MPLSIFLIEHKYKTAGTAGLACGVHVRHVYSFKGKQAMGDEARILRHYSWEVQVDCIAGNGQQCPLCREAIKYKGMYPKPVDIAKDSIYMPVVVLDKKTSAGIERLNELQVWKRGVKFYKTDLSPHASRNGNLFNGVTEVERLGKRGDQATQMRLFGSASDYDGNPYPAPKSLDEAKAEVGYTDDVLYGSEDSLIRSWTAEQMEEAIATGQYPRTATTEQPAQEEAPQPRNRTAQVDYGF